MLLAGMLIYLNMFGTLIDFDSQDWTANQFVSSIFIVEEFSYGGTTHFYTNYGYDLDVYNVSLFYVFEDEEQFEITNNNLFNFESLAVYQVSESSTDTLIIEGWKGGVKKYSSAFLNVTMWEVLLLGYTGIDKVVFRLGKTDYAELTDFNFDNFLFTRAIPEMVGSVSIRKVK